MYRQNLNTEEWRSRDEHLKEIEDALIPSSQSLIDWQDSDDDDDVQCLTFPLKRRCTVDINKSIIRKSKADFFRKNYSSSAELPNSPVFKKSNSVISNSKNHCINLSLMNSVVCPSLSTFYSEAEPNKLATTFNRPNLQTSSKHFSNNNLERLDTEVLKLNEEIPEIIKVFDKTENSSSYYTGGRTSPISNSKIISPNIFCKKMHVNYNGTKGNKSSENANLQYVKENMFNRNKINVDGQCFQQSMTCSNDNNMRAVSLPTSPIFNSSKNCKQFNNLRNESQQLNGPIFSCKKNIYPEICDADSEYWDLQCDNIMETDCSNTATSENDLPNNSKKSDEVEIIDIVNYRKMAKRKRPISLFFNDPSNLLHNEDKDRDDLKIVHTNLIKKGFAMQIVSNDHCIESSEGNCRTAFNKDDLKERNMEPLSHIRNIGKGNRNVFRSQLVEPSQNLLCRNVLMLANNSSASANDSYDMNRPYYDEDTDSENYFPEQIESSFTIDNFSSPISDMQKKNIERCNDSYRCLEIEEEYNECSLESRNVNKNEKKGSEWVKNLTRTPDKISSWNNPEDPAQEAPDSSKKKFKKEGLADHLKKLIKSWQSDASMFNHQMFQVDSNLLQTCSDSPLVGSHLSTVDPNTSDAKIKILQCLKSNFDLQSPIPNENRCSYKSNSEYQSNLITDLKGLKDFSYNYRGIKKSLCQYGNNNNTNSPETPQISKLQKLRRSLEVSPASSSSLSSCKSFFVPQKHICLLITWIFTDCLSSDTISIECRETDDCYNQSIRKGTEIFSQFSSSYNSEYKANKQSQPSVCRAISRSYFVLLNQFGHKNSKQLQIGDEIKIFAPWEVLDVEKLNMMTIFSSYFVIKSNNLKEDHQLATSKQKIHLASWSCSCFNGHVVPSVCDRRSLKLFDDGSAATKEMKVPEIKKFDSVLGKEKSSSKMKNQIWTVLEAIEYSGGRPDVFVHVTARICRIIPSRNLSHVWNPVESGQPSQFIMLCQDPSCTFFIICIPNRPMTSTLQSLIDEGEGSVQTLSNLVVCHRITTSQDPSLFSLIHSLHISYKSLVECDVKLNGLLADFLTRPFQTFCYKFLVTLGKTEHVVVTKSDGLYFKEKLWSIEEAISNESYRQRGKLAVNIFYYFHPCLYVVCQKKRYENMNVLDSLQILTVKTRIWLPPWISCNGTIMSSAIIRDIFFSKAGELLIDEYSSIIRMNKDFKVKFIDMLKLVPKLNIDAVTYDLVTVEGYVLKVIEEDAYIWLECEFCCEYLPDSEVLLCQNCKKENVTPLVKYSMEIELYDPLTKVEYVKIKLFQKTIEHLLKTCKLVNNIAYDSTLLQGKKLMPLICIVKSVNSNSSSASTVYNLIEMPY